MYSRGEVHTAEGRYIHPRRGTSDTYSRGKVTSGMYSRGEIRTAEGRYIRHVQPRGGTCSRREVYMHNQGFVHL